MNVKVLSVESNILNNRIFLYILNKFRISQKSFSFQVFLYFKNDNSKTDTKISVIVV